MLKGHTNYDLKKSLTSMEFRVTGQGIERDYKSLTGHPIDKEWLSDPVWLGELAKRMEATYHEFLKETAFSSIPGSPPVELKDVPESFLKPNPALATAIAVPVTNTEYQDAEVTQVPVYVAPILSDEAKASLEASRNAFLFG
jgi:hypothetical protein